MKRFHPKPQECALKHLSVIFETISETTASSTARTTETSTAATAATSKVASAATLSASFVISVALASIAITACCYAASTKQIEAVGEGEHDVGGDALAVAVGS